uniref:ATPase, P-type (Transporting), HAD superfamily, subfamily IC n=1 Tax=Caulobacter sp. (strain K31) TaxID=366602 RepID=B0SVN9_CAUSK
MRQLMNVAVDPSSSLQTPFAAARIRHYIPGRTRLELTPTSGDLRDRLARGLERRGWVLAGFSGATRSLLVRHPPECSPTEVLDTIIELLGEPGGAGFDGALARAPAAPSPRRQGDDLTRLMTAHAEAALEMLGSSRSGLDQAEARRRLARHGPNALPPPKRRSPASMAGGQLATLPVGLLAGSAVLSLATGGAFDAAATLGVIALNAGIGFFTENAVESLIARLGRPVEHATVIVRSGVALTAPARDVAPGDILALGPGQSVPADARLIEANDLTLDESILTGESLGVEKSAAPLALGEVPLAERVNMVHAGTVVIGGQGLAVAARTGPRTEAAAVRVLIASARPPKPVIEEKLDQFSRTLVFGALAASGVVLAIGLIRRRPTLTMIRSAVSLAVASLPEGLPAVATTTFALEAKAMERQGVFVRMLPAIESIGAIDTLCLDKTGTLTENRMSVAGAAAGSAIYHANGTLSLTREDGLAAQDKDGRALAALAEAVALCNMAELDADGAGVGSGTEVALLAFAALAGVNIPAVRATAPRRAARERSQLRRYMVTVHERDDETLLFLKGAPEDVLALCRHERRSRGRVGLDESRRAEIQAQNTTLAARGQRVLGVARQRSRAGAFDPERPDDLEWLGLVGLSDPLRSDARGAIATFHAAGIRTLMITGDHPVTANAIAQGLDLSAGGAVTVLTGSDMAAMDDVSLARAAREATVFARVTPADKLRIVRALQASGAVVGMLGDGVNDGPALREARVGIAMGKKGSDVAREVADVVIADDDLAALARAVGRGRSTDDNIKNAVRFLLSTNLSEVMLMLVESFGAPQELETPMELLWLNLVTDILPAIGLAMAEPAGDVMARAPSSLRGPILDGAEYRKLGLDALQIAAVSLVAHFASLGRAPAGPQTRTATFVTLAGAQIVHAFSLRDRTRGDPRARSISERRLDLSLAGAAGLLVLPFALPGLGRALGIGPLSPAQLGLSGGLVGASLVLSELRRMRPPKIQVLGGAAPT